MRFSPIVRSVVMAAGILLLVCGASDTLYAQKKGKKGKTEEAAPPVLPQRTYRVDGGLKTETTAGAADSTALRDSLGGRVAAGPQRVGSPGSPQPGAEAVAHADSLGGGADSLGNAITDPFAMESDPAASGVVGVEKGTFTNWTEGAASHTRADSLQADSLGITLAELDRLRELDRVDSLDSDEADPEVFMGRRERRLLAREERMADTTRINRIFRDSIPISRVAFYSTVLPGFSQLYNSQAWKIPILYGTVGVSTYFWMKERKEYNKYKSKYDYLIKHDFERKKYGDEIDDAQRKMIRHNTAKQLWMFAAVGSYIYFIGDGVINYPGMTNSVKKATTLSTIFPGAGQIYNGSYWKVPIVIGGTATFAMMIDWNNRGYKRFKTAYNDAINQNPNGEFKERYFSNPEFLKNLKQSYRRNRDLCIILAGAFYIFNIIDAHVDAHMRSYDISDDLAMDIQIQPAMSNLYTFGGGNTNTFGLSLCLTF